MVSYFLPRSNYLLKTVNLRRPPAGEKRWATMRWTLRRPMSTKIDEKVPLIDKNSNLNLKSDQLSKPKVETNGRKHRGGWFSWTGLLFRWAPMGFCIFGSVDWQLHKRRMANSNLPKTASAFQSSVYCMLPLRIVSRCWGWIAECYVPTPLRPYIYGWYSQAFFVNLQEAANPDFKHYSSLAEFFTRPLKDGVRYIDERCDLVSPADGKVLHFGPASTNSHIEQVKGVTYSMESFLGPWTSDDEKEPSYLNKIKHNKSDDTTLYQCVIYLAPGDYHRFHSPVEWEPAIRRHFPGELLSVSPKIANWLPGLFCLNERALYMGKWKHGFFSFTAVGATNVGSVKIYFDDELKTNQWIKSKPNQYAERALPQTTKLDKGQLVGQFNMGSTVVLLFEAPKDFQFTITPGQKIRVGEPIGFVGKEAHPAPHLQISIN